MSALLAAPVREFVVVVEGGEVDSDNDANDRAGGLACIIAGDGLTAASLASLSLLLVLPVDASLLCAL